MAIAAYPMMASIFKSQQQEMTKTEASKDEVVYKQDNALKTNSLMVAFSIAKHSEHIRVLFNGLLFAMVQLYHQS